MLYSYAQTKTNKATKITNTENSYPYFSPDGRKSHTPLRVKPERQGFRMVLELFLQGFEMEVKIYTLNLYLGNQINPQGKC